MDRVVVSAPGKLILMGEHAVVYGRPGLVSAIDRRLRVSVASRSGSEVRLDLPRLGERHTLDWAAIHRAARDARDRWRRRFVDETEEPGGVGVTPGELVTLALGETSLDLGEDQPEGLELRVDSDLPVGSGLGSSAALAVGVVGAYLALRNGELDPTTIARLALEVERRQHGLPSGVDHTAVLRGGLLWIERDPDGLRCRAVSGASPLLGSVRVFHSGSPAEPTGEVVAAVRARRRARENEVESACDTIGEATVAFRDALAGSDPGPLVDAVRRCEAALESLGVVPSEARKVVRRIEAEGGAAKISGAGSLSGPGAGSVLVLHPEPERIDRWSFLDGWRPFPLRLPADGLRREPA